MQVTNGEQEHARTRAHTLGAPKDKATSDSAQHVDKTADSDFVGGAATVVLPAFLAALIATRFSGTRHSNSTTTSAMVVTSMAAVPVAIGAASGLGWCLRRCFSSGPARDLWGKAGGVLQPRKEETGLKPSFVVLCQMGIEDIVEEEIVACLEKVGLDWHTSRSRILKQGIRGLVMVASGGDDETEGVLLGLRTANYVLAYHCW